MQKKINERRIISKEKSESVIILQQLNPFILEITLSKKKVLESFSLVIGNYAFIKEVNKFKYFVNI